MFQSPATSGNAVTFIVLMHVRHDFAAGLSGRVAVLRLLTDLFRNCHEILFLLPARHPDRYLDATT